MGECVNVQVIHVSVRSHVGQASFSLHTEQNTTTDLHGLGTPNRTYGHTHPHLNQAETGCRGRGGSTSQYSRVHYATAQGFLLTQAKRSTLKPPAALCLSAGMCSSYASSVRNTTAA